MKLWRRLLRPFGVTDPSPPLSSLPSSVPDSTSAPDPVPPAPPAPAADPGWPEGDIRLAFGAWLLGQGDPGERLPTPAQKRLLAALRQVAQPGGDDPQVPRLPAVLPRLMRLVRRDDYSVRELADLLAGEPALLGEVMRLANAPGWRGSATRLSSLDEAVAMLGQTGMQALLARAVMVPVFGTATGRPGATAAALWELAGQCAEDCAREQPVDCDAFEARLAGMVACTGWLVAVRLLERQGVAGEPPGRVFLDALGHEVHRLAARIARHWHLPDTVVQAVEALDQPAAIVAPGSLAATLRRAVLLNQARAARPGDPSPA